SMLGNSRGRIGGPGRVTFQTLARARELATQTYRAATSSTRIGYSVRQAASTVAAAAAEAPEQRNGGNGSADAHETYKGNFSAERRTIKTISRAASRCGARRRSQPR